jgi:phage shock protein E
MSFLKRYWVTLAGIITGALAGYWYWHQAGCTSGNCLITSKPVNATLYGALMGGLIFSMFKTKKYKRQQ